MNLGINVPKAFSHTIRAWSVQELLGAIAELKRDYFGSSPNQRVYIERQINDIDAELVRREGQRTEFTRLEKALKDLWEGCISWSEAIEMIGRPDPIEVAELRRRWNGWNRKFIASQKAW